MPSHTATHPRKPATAHHHKKPAKRAVAPAPPTTSTTPTAPGAPAADGSVAADGSATPAPDDADKPTPFWTWTKIGFAVLLLVVIILAIVVSTSGKAAAPGGSAADSKRAAACAKNTDEAACAKVSKCTWNADTCEAKSCSAYTSQASCAAASGITCNWDKNECVEGGGGLAPGTIVGIVFAVALVLAAVYLYYNPDKWAKLKSLGWKAEKVAEKEGEVVAKEVKEAQQKRLDELHKQDKQTRDENWEYNKLAGVFPGFQMRPHELLA